MKKVLVLPSWYPNEMKPDFAPYVRAQALSLAKYGLEVTVVYSAPYSWKWVFKQRRLMFGNRESYIGNFREILFYLPKSHCKRVDRAVRGIIGHRLIRQLERKGYQPDIIHVHTYESGPLALWLRDRINVPVIITEHYTGFARNILNKWELDWARCCFEAVDLRLAVSKAFARLLEIRTGLKFRVLPNFIDTSFFSPGNILENACYDFLSVGHLLPKKNHAMLIEAFSRLSPKERRFKLGIIGEGPMRKKLVTLVKSLGLENQVDFLGYRDAVGVRNLLRKSRIFCMPSSYETFGIAVVEAMAVGIPAVVTLCGGPEEIVVNGLNGLVTQLNVQSYATALEEALTHDWVKDAIRQRAVVLYSEAVIISELQTVYNEVIEKHQRSAKQSRP